jgi:drug/metabolite transporter (DMT)-like permease
MTYQLRILTTALLMVIILDRRFSYLQWMSLIMSLIGAITVQLGGHTPNESHKGAVETGISDQIAGLTAVLIMCMTNAFGGVYLEAVMKKSADDIFLQNIRLSLISLPMSAITIFSDYETIEKRKFVYLFGVSGTLQKRGKKAMGRRYLVFPFIKKNLFFCCVLETLYLFNLSIFKTASLVAGMSTFG